MKKQIPHSKETLKGLDADKLIKIILKQQTQINFVQDKLEAVDRMLVDTTQQLESRERQRKAISDALIDCFSPELDDKIYDQMDAYRR